MNNAIRGAVVAVLILGGSVYAWNWWTGSPQYSLKQIQTSIEDHDVETFEKHVDLQTLLERLVDDLVSTGMQDAAQEAEDEWEEIGAALGAGIVEMIKPKLLNRLESEIIQWVETGEAPFSEFNEQSGKEESAAAPADASVGALEDSMDIRSLDDIDVAIEVKGKTALVRAEFDQAELDERYEAVFVMRDKGDHWTLVEWRNAVELVEQIDADKQERLAAANDAIYEEIYEAVALQEASMRAFERNWSPYVESRFVLRNTGEKPVTVLEGEFLIRSPDGAELAHYPFNWSINGAMKPGEIVEETVEFDINQFMEDDVRLYELAGDSQEPDYRIYLKRVEFANGNELAVYDSFGQLPDELKTGG